jgi:lipopolysaccharide export system protein LptA
VRLSPALLATAIAIALPGAVAAARASARPAGAEKRAAPGKGPPTHVVADQIEYRYRERRTVMTGKPLVVLTREDSVLMCRRLVADSDEEGDIRHAVCEGDVKLTRGERIVTCARATYDGEEGQVVCRGDPVMRDGKSVLRCEVLVYDLDADRVTAMQASGTVVQKPRQRARGRRSAASGTAAGGAAAGGTKAAREQGAPR